MFEHAEWIGCNGDFGDICPEFMRDMAMEGEVKRASLFITAIGVYEAFLNGARVGDFVLAPGCTVYRERLQYQEYDVTDMLKAENRLTVTVGTGWHRGRISAGSRDINEMPAAIIGQLEIAYADGKSDTIVTDGSWQVRKSRILFSDIYDGEIIDEAAEGDAYRAVKTLPELSRGRLIPQEGEKVCEHERIKPVRYLVTPKGERVLDFGQNLAGIMELRVNAKKGDRIVISCAEILDKDGNFYTENYRSAKSQLTYICREGEQTCKPHLTFFGFRYLRLDEYPCEVNADDFTAIALYSDMKRTGSIECGDERINQLFSNTLWSQRSNFIDIPTDCPQRDERMGWTGDAQVFCRTACYNYNVKRFFEKWLADVRAEQYEDGMVCDIVPNFWRMRRGSAAWGDVITIVPWQLYLMYGDKGVLADNFDAMKKWVDYMTKDSTQEYLWTCAPEQKKLWGKHYGDWLAQDAPYGSYIGATDVDFVSSAFYAYSVSLLIKSGKALGRNMTEYERLYEKIVHTFKRTFPKLETQTAHVLALQFGLTDDREETAAELVRMIRENGNRLQTGFAGTPFLLHALSGSGYADVAYDLLFQEAFPSWLYEVEHGATTIWEHWDGIRDDGTLWSNDMNSYNHYSYGCVMDWIYGVAAGIQTMEEHPGFERAVIKPTPNRRMGWLNAALETRFGTIRSKWVCGEDKVRYEISTPVKAVIVIGGREYPVEKGDYIFYSSMPNPWEEIPLDDYENHMKLDSVMQLQAMNEMMRGQFDTYAVSSVMILGIAGGNGLEHIQKDKFERVYGVDVNSSYLREVIRRYPNLEGLLECLCVNLIGEADKLPEADMVIANLLIEYIGYECFQKAIRQVNPRFVSCIIQINVEDSWVSDSPYLHVFDGLEQVHHQMEEQALEQAMSEIGYHAIKTLEHLLPNGKKLVQLDFEK